MTLVWDDEAVDMNGDTQDLGGPLDAYADWWVRNLITKPTEEKIVRFASDPVMPGGPAQQIAPFKPNTRCDDQKLEAHVTEDKAKKEDVIIGIIDDGIAFANCRFLKREDNLLRTRFGFFWNQEAKCQDQSLVPFGREWAEKELNTLIFGSEDGGLAVDEDTAYQATEMDRSNARRISHGTHVADLATGYDCDSTKENGFGEDPSVLSGRRPIIGVHLPRIATRDSSGSFLSVYISHAVMYVLQRAKDLQPGDGSRVPLVLNFSYGINAGSHDGKGELEDWLDKIVELVRSSNEFGFPISIILPSGNMLQSRTHSRLSFQFDEDGSAASRHISMRLQPDNKASTFVEIWTPLLESEDGSFSHNNLHINVKPSFADDFLEPSKENDFGPSKGIRLKDCKGRLIGMAYFEYFERDDAGGNGTSKSYRQRLTLALAPTRFEQPTRYSVFDQYERSAAPGNWDLEISYTPKPKEVGDEPRVETCELWVQRGDTPAGYAQFGRQSYFDDPHYVEFDETGRLEEEDQPGSSNVFRAGTLNAIATGGETIRVGSYRMSNITRDRGDADQRTKNRRASWFSSAGYADSENPGARVVDVGAASEQDHALEGVFAAGSRSGSNFRFTGTSTSAPQIARYIAWQFNSDSNFGGTRQEVTDLASQDSSGNKVWFVESTQSDRTGAGLLRYRRH